MYRYKQEKLNQAQKLDLSAALTKLNTHTFAFTPKR